MKRLRRGVAVFSVLVLLVSCARTTAPFDPQPDRARKLVVVETTTGRVAGFEAESGLHVFLGIPYAEPPVGNLRFAPPRPVERWTHVRPAYRFGPTCPQMEDEYEPASLLHQDEDCLSVNIWTPGADPEKRPVVVYIHGGGFIEGGSGDPLYDGQHLARRGDIVVASLNYRVAALGFLFLDDVGPEFSGSGNLALQDQTAGLTWIKNNIERFGGDPDQVTIMGESAGSTSVMFHMISPGSRGLFHQAIAQSGAINLSRTREQAAKVTQRFMALAGVEDVSGLRALPAPTIVELEKTLLDDVGFEADIVFSPVLDGVVTPVDPFQAFEDGAAAGVPLLHGTNLDEFRYCHAIELPFVFRTFDSPTSDQIVGPNPPLELSDAMMDAWIRFIRTGNPDPTGASSWRAYEPEHRTTRIFDAEPAQRDDPDKDARQLYESILYGRPDETTEPR